DVGRQEIGGELNPLEVAAKRARERLGQRCLPDPGYVLDQEVSVGEKNRERRLNGRALSHNRGFDGRYDALGLCSKFGCVQVEVLSRAHQMDRRGSPTAAI